MEKFELMLVLLVPIVALFCVAILPLMPFIYYQMKFTLSWILVVGSLVLTVILLVRKKYSGGDIVKVLLGGIFSLAGFVFAIWTVFHWYNIAAILLVVVLSIVGIVLSLVLLRRPRHETSLDSYEETGYGTTTPRPTSSPGFFRIYRDPILYFVFFMVVGIIAVAIYRPQIMMSNILYGLGLGAAFGFLGACCMIGSGRTKFVRE